MSYCETDLFGDLPQNSVAVIELGQMLLVVKIRLSDCDKSMFSIWNVAFPDSVMTTDISRVNPWIIRRLDATRAT